MKERIIGYGILAAVILIAGLVVNQIKANPQAQLSAASPNYASTAVRINNQTFAVELAISADQQALGLGQRSVLAPNTGMLFVFDTPETPTFWMKDMRFNIDIVWIRDGKIVDLTRNALAPNIGTKADELPLYTPVSDVDYVLEINSGQSESMKIGDRVDIVDSQRI